MSVIDDFCLHRDEDDVNNVCSLLKNHSGNHYYVPEAILEDATRTIENEEKVNQNDLLRRSDG
jgi:hypothetical protein